MAAENIAARLFALAKTPQQRRSLLAFLQAQLAPQANAQLMAPATGMKGNTQSLQGPRMGSSAHTGPWAPHQPAYANRKGI